MVSGGSSIDTATADEPLVPFSCKIETRYHWTARTVGSNDDREVTLRSYLEPEPLLLRHLRVRLGQIGEMADAPSVGPAEHAEVRLHDHLQNVMPLIPDIQLPHISMLEDGCIYLEWRNANRFLALVAYRDGLLRQYQSNTDSRTSPQGAVISDPDPKQTAESLNWLIGSADDDAW